MVAQRQDVLKMGKQRNYHFGQNHIKMIQKIRTLYLKKYNFTGCILSYTTHQQEIRKIAKYKNPLMLSLLILQTLVLLIGVVPCLKLKLNSV